MLHCNTCVIPVFKDTSVRWPVTKGRITTVTKGLVSPAIEPVPPVQVGLALPLSNYICCGSACTDFPDTKNTLCSSTELKPNIPEMCLAGTGIEACTKCADGYLLEDWRCVSTCSSGYYLSEQTSDSGQVQRSCKKWVSTPANTSSPQWTFWSPVLRDK